MHAGVSGPRRTPICKSGGLTPPPQVPRSRAETSVPSRIVCLIHSSSSLTHARGMTVRASDSFQGYAERARAQG